VTPEQAEEVFYQAYNEAMQQARNWSKPVVQRECWLAGWAAVLDAIRKEPE
jgi:hypothetical protein